MTVSTCRTEHGAEVDFIVDSPNNSWAIELKASKNVGKADLRGLSIFSENVKKPHQLAIAYLGKVSPKLNVAIQRPPASKAFTRYFHEQLAENYQVLDHCYFADNEHQI